MTTCPACHAVDNVSDPDHPPCAVCGIELSAYCWRKCASDHEHRHFRNLERGEGEFAALSEDKDTLRYLLADALHLMLCSLDPGADAWLESLRKAIEKANRP